RHRAIYGEACRLARDCRAGRLAEQEARDILSRWAEDHIEPDTDGGGPALPERLDAAWEKAKAEAADASVPLLNGISSPDRQEIVRLAALSPLDYDRQRKDAAKRMGITTSTLDKCVHAVHGEE